MFDDNIFNTNQRPIEITEEQAKAARIERFGYDPENPQEAPEGPMPQPKVLPGTGYEPGMFEGAWEAPFKGLGAAALGSASTALSLVGEVAPGDTFRSYAKDLRKLNRKWFEPDPEEMGQVGQIIRSLFEYVPKFAIYTAATGNPVTGAAAFGVDTGAGEYYRLRDEGVKTSTAMQAGAVTGVGNMLGGIIPAAVGTSRAMSAIYGAASNVALDAGERAAVRTILENDNYQKIANRYETSWADVALSAGLGGFFGTIAWRSPEQIQKQLREDQINRRADTIASIVTKKLKDTGLFPNYKIKTQVAPNARSAAALLENAGKSDDEIADIVYRDMTSIGGDDLGMPITQGRQWIFGDRASRNPDRMVRVTDVASVEEKGRVSDVVGAELDKYKIDSYKRLSENDPEKFLKNDDTGWLLSINGGDRSEIISAVTKRGDRLANLAAVKNLRELVKNAFLAESYRDIKAAQGVKGADTSIKGIHRFYAPMRLGGENYLVKLTVKDKVGQPKERGALKDDRTALYQLVSIESRKMKSAQSVTSERSNEVGTLTADGTSRPQSIGLSRTNQLRRPHGEPSFAVSVREMLTEVNRDGDVRFIDGKKDESSLSEFFVNEPNKWALEEGGGYYNTPEDIASWESSGEGQLFQRTIKIKAENSYDPNWRPLRRTADNMTPEETAVFNEYIDSRPDAARIRDNFDRLEGTPWATQAREAVFIRSSMLDLMAGREPRVQSMLDHPQMAGLKRLLQKHGEEGMWLRLSKTGFVGDAAKPAHNVNGSFLDCSPSLDCAKFCYATEGRYRYAANVVKSELIAEAIRRDPVRAAEMTALEYKATPEFVKGKALRLYDKGDGNSTWLPYINELNNRGIRVQIFSKRADFLRQVSDFNLRLLSIDASNLRMADENPDLNVAFVYSDASQIPTILKIHHEGRLSVILPVKEGVKYMSAEKVNELRSADKTLAKHICPIDAGWKMIKSNRQPDGWNCTMCDKNAGVGCFHGASTDQVMRMASQNEAELIDVEGMDLVALAKLLQKELGNDLERVAKSGESSGRAESQLGSVEGSSGGSGTINVSGSLAHKLQALLTGVIRGGERNLRQGASEQTGGVRRNAKSGRAGMEEASGELGGGVGKRGAAGTQQSDGQGSAGKSGPLGESDALEQRLSSQIAGSYSAKLNRIILTALADLSTFSHEHAHWYMTKLIAYAGEEGMSSEVVQDAIQLLNAMGIKSLDDWNAMSFEQQRVYHERFGAWVEIYLSKGRSPVRSLEDVFKRFGQWLVDMYRNKFGKTAEEHVGDRYKAEFDEDLPPLSDEVMAVLDRMYGADAKARTVIPSVAQTVAARIAQAERANTDKVTSPMKDRNSDTAYRAAKAAQIDARDQMNEGQKVDVSSSVREDDANADMVASGTKTFARTAQMGGENDTIVVLQNRDRSTVASQAQMNSIAADPQYGKLSFSRTTDSGAPIVSYGSLPADEFVGNSDYVSDGGKRIPVTYAVVEADSIMTSNTWDGRQNETYGSDPETIQAVAGNGRVAGLQEAYNRGTTDAYVQEMQADTTHGVSPEAIGKLQKPVLVRYVGRENVTTGFVDRSNQSAVLDMSGKERAVKDAGKLTSTRMRGYTFDEDGNPTRDTLERFVNDIGEPSSLGALIDDNGLPTDRARDRIRAAVFYAAYRDEELTALVVDSSDKQGIKRILNAMSAFAPNVIAIREASNGAIDIGPVIVEAVNRIRSGRLIGEGDMFEETNPAVDQVFNILSQNRNSAAAIGRVFNDFMDRIEAALGGGTDALFGDAPDLAMAMQYLRAAENAQGQRLLELGKEFAPLPDIDVESVRATLAAIQEAAPNAEKVAVAMGEKVLEDAGAATKAEPAVETQTIDPRDPARAGAVFTESADVERLRNLFAEDPEAAYVVEGPDGVAREMTAQDILDMERQYAEQGQTDAVGIGKATECILRNGGIKE